MIGAVKMLLVVLRRLLSLRLREEFNLDRWIGRVVCGTGSWEPMLFNESSRSTHLEEPDGTVDSL
jgi:hypothetical protein